jgi:hypothetical protein
MTGVFFSFGLIIIINVINFFNNNTVINFFAGTSHEDVPTGPVTYRVIDNATQRGRPTL